MAMPQYRVEIAFNAGYSTPAASRTWTDISAYVEPNQVTITRGRLDERQKVSVSTLTGLALNNTDGRFTPEDASSPYYPNVKKGRPIRVVAVHNGSDSIRFTGYVDEWLPSWPEAVASYATVAVPASSRRSRTGKSAELRSVAEEEIRLRSPQAYYTFGDPAGSPTAADSSGRARPALMQVGSGAAVAFGSASGPGTDGLTAAQFSGGKYLAMPAALTGAGTFDLSIVFAFNAPAAPATNSMDVAGHTNGGPQFRIDTAGRLHDTGFSNTTTTASVADGQNHIAVFIYDDSVGCSLYVDGTLVSSTLNGVGTANNQFFVGGDSSTATTGDSYFTGVIAHFAVYDKALTPADAVAITDSMRTAFDGESSGGRIARLAAYAGIPAAEVQADTGSSSIVHVDPTGKAPLELMEGVTETENGVLYDGRDGKLVFKGRAARYNAASAFTLDASLEEVEADLAPALDDQFLINDVTVTDADGQAVRLVDQTSLDEYGAYREQLDLVTSSDHEALAAAQWRVGLYSDPRLRWNQVTVDITNATVAKATSVLAAEIGTRFQVANMPAQAPTSTLDLFVEGYIETLSPLAHSISFNTSPTDGYAGTNGVWQLDVNSLDGPAVLAY